MPQDKRITIYKIVNICNGKTYIGQTTNFVRRVREHKRGKNPNAAVHRAIEKYGAQNFAYETICVCANKQAADAIEVCLIKIWGTQKQGYNLTPGGLGTGIGENNHRWGKANSLEQRLATAESNKKRKGFVTSEETKKKLSEANKGRTFTEEHRQKLTLSQTGDKNHRYGKKASAETRAKLSAIRKGKPKPPEFAEKQRANMLRIWAERKAIKCQQEQA